MKHCSIPELSNKTYLLPKCDLQPQWLMFLISASGGWGRRTTLSLRSDSAVKRKTKTKSVKQDQVSTSPQSSLVLSLQRPESRTYIAGSSDQLLNTGPFLRHPGRKQDGFSFPKRINYNGSMTTDYILAQGSTQTCMSCAQTPEKAHPCGRFLTANYRMSKLKENPQKE